MTLFFQFRSFDIICIAKVENRLLEAKNKWRQITKILPTFPFFFFFLYCIFISYYLSWILSRILSQIIENIIYSLNSRSSFVISRWLKIASVTFTAFFVGSAIKYQFLFAVYIWPIQNLIWAIERNTVARLFSPGVSWPGLRRPFFQRFIHSFLLHSELSFVSYFLYSSHPLLTDIISVKEFSNNFLCNVFN